LTHIIPSSSLQTFSLKKCSDLIHSFVHSSFLGIN
jgi:hypothetical protein